MADAKTKRLIHNAVEIRAFNDIACWNTPLHWAAIATSIMEVIGDTRLDLTSDHIRTLVCAAAMAQRQAVLPQTTGDADVRADDYPNVPSDCGRQSHG